MDFPYLVNFSIVQISTVRNVLSAHLVIHVGPDSARSNAVHRDLLVTHVYETVRQVSGIF
jgi:hypothetical protein